MLHADNIIFDFYKHLLWTIEPHSIDVEWIFIPYFVLNLELPIISPAVTMKANCMILQQGNMRPFIKIMFSIIDTIALHIESAVQRCSEKDSQNF